jgi:Zn ribbon nucleic-acid-binding protein
MIERLPVRQRKEAGEEKVIVFECLQCGHTEYQRLIASFWRRLTA